MKISGKRIKIIPFATMSYRIRMGAEVLEFQLFFRQHIPHKNLLEKQTIHKLP